MDVCVAIRETSSDSILTIQKDEGIYVDTPDRNNEKRRLYRLPVIVHSTKSIATEWIDRWGSKIIDAAFAGNDVLILSFGACGISKRSCLFGQDGTQFGLCVELIRLFGLLDGYSKNAETSITLWKIEKDQIIDLIHSESPFENRVIVTSGTELLQLLNRPSITAAIQDTKSHFFLKAVTHRSLLRSETSLTFVDLADFPSLTIRPSKNIYREHAIDQERSEKHRKGVQDFVQFMKLVQSLSTASDRSSFWSFSKCLISDGSIWNPFHEGTTLIQQIAALMKHCICFGIGSISHFEDDWMDTIQTLRLATRLSKIKVFQYFL